MKHQLVHIYELYLAVLQGLFTLRGVYQLKSGGTHVPFVSLTPFHPFSTLGVLDPSGNVKPVKWDIKDTVSSQPV